MKISPYFISTLFFLLFSFSLQINENGFLKNAKQKNEIINDPIDNEIDKEEEEDDYFSDDIESSEENIIGEEENNEDDIKDNEENEENNENQQSDYSGDNDNDNEENEENKPDSDYGNDEGEVADYEYEDINTDDITDEGDETDDDEYEDTDTDEVTDEDIDTDSDEIDTDEDTDEDTSNPAIDENKDRTHVNIKCLFVAKYNVYTLQKLTKNDQYELNVNTTNSKGKLRFNICKDLKDLKSTMVYRKNKTETEKEPTLLTVLNEENEDEKEIQIAGSIDGDSNSKNEWKEIDEDDGTKGVKIRLSEGEKCKGSARHVTYLRIICDEKIEDDEFENSFNFSRFNQDDCVHYIEAKSIYGCALNDWYLLRRLVNQYNYIFATLTIAVGLFLLLWGKKFQTPTVVIVSGILICYFISVIILSFIPGLIQTEGHLCILLAVGFIAGGVLGYCIKEKIKVLSIIMGGCAGYSVGEFIYQFIAGFVTINPIVLFWVCIAICIILGCVVGYWLFNTAIIFGTSILGGYIAMRGVTFIFGNYMEEAEFVDLAKNGEWEQLKDIKNGWVYLYLGLWLVLSIFGIYYQCRKFKKSENDKKDKKDKDESKKLL